MKLKHFIFALVAMLLSFVSPAFAQVAKVGNTEYETIDEAIANWTDGTTLTLLADVTLSDVVTLKSTEHHTLDLGTYTMTAASGKNAIEITCEGRSSASYAITVNADATNPGGITATGKACVYYSKSGSTKDRPIIRIYNGVFDGSYSINSKSNGNTNCPQVWIYGGTFNGNVNLTKNMLRVFGGTFNGWINCTGDSSAYREISGGRFKSWQFMTADADNKFWVGTSKANYNVGVYVDDEGYLCVGGPVITEVSAKYPAVASNYSKWSSYLKYSAAATYGLFYEDADAAIKKHGAANVTVYEHAEVVEELDNNEAVKDFTPVLPEDVKTFEVEAIDVEATAEATTKVTFNVEPKNASGQKVSNPSAEITFRLPVPAAWSGKANVYHEGTLLGAYTIKEESGAKYVEVSSSSFSEFSVEAIVPTEVEVATLAELQAALADNSNELPIIITETIVIPEGETVVLDLNGKTVTRQDEANQYALRNLGDLTIKDTKGNGSINARGIYNGYGNGGANVATAKITVVNGTINAKGTNGGGAAIFNYGVADIQGGTFTSVASYAIALQTGSTMTIGENAIITGGINSWQSTLTITGGTISNDKSGKHVVYAGESAVTINGGTFHNNNSGNATIMASGSTAAVEITGGTFTLNIVDASSSYLIDATSSATYTISGGSFTGGIRAQGGTKYEIAGGTFTNEYGNYNVYEGGDINISGGTFTGSYAQNFATDNLAAGYELSETGTVVAKPVAEVNGVKYASFAEAAAAAQAGNEIKLLANIEGDITVPANVTLNGNGFAISGGIFAEGDITFAGVTTAADFDANVVNTAVNIPAGASLQLTGSARLVIGHGATFNITGTIEDAKTADKATLVPSLKIAAGASITGNGVTFNVNNAYIVANANTTSKNSNANGTLDFNINNSIWEQTGVLAFYVPTSGKDPVVNFELKNSVLTTTSHLVFSVTKGEVVIDNSNVNVGKSNQIENRSTMTIKNGSVVNGAVATSSNAINPGTIIVENATYAVTGEFSGAAEGTGTLIIKKDANVSVGSIKAGANVTVDAEGMAAGDEINFTANLSQFTGTLSVINNDKLEASIVDGKVVLAAKPVAKIDETPYATLEEAFAAATDGQTITMLVDATPALTSQRAITKAAVIDLGGKTMTLKEDDLYFGTTTFKNGTIVVDPSVKPSTAVFWMFANQTLTFDNVKVVATGVTGTYLIGLEGENSDLNLLNGSEILVENTTALDLDIICVNGTNTCDIKVENSKVNVTNLDGRVFFRGNYTVKDSEVNLAGITKAGFRIEAGQTLSIEGTSEVNIEGEPRDGGIHLTDASANYTKAETATVNATLNRPAVAKIGDTPYYSFAEAAAAAQAGDEIVMLADATVEGTLALPAGIKLTSNGHTITGSIRMLGDLELNGPLTITGGLWVGKSGETLTATLSGDKLTAMYFMFQRGTYTINADIDAVYGYLSFEGAFEVNSTIHTTGANGEVLYINGNVTLNDGAVLDSDNSVFVNNNNAVLTLKPGSKVDSNVNITASGAKLNIDATGMAAGASANITGTVTNSANGTIAVVGNDKLVAQIVNGKIVLAAKVAMIGEISYTTLQAAIEAVQEGETITVLEDITFTTGANGSTNGISYTRGASFTLDLNGKTITSNLGNNALRFKIGDGNTVRDTEVTVLIKNGKIVSGSNNWCAISAATADNSGNKLILNLTDLTIEANKAGDFAVKSWAGAVVNTNNVDVTSNYAGGFYAVGGEIVLDENSSVAQKGLHTAPYMSYAFGVSSGTGKMTVNGGTYSAVPAAASDGYNQGVSHGSSVGGVMSSGGTLIINGGTFSNDNFGDAAPTAPRSLIMADAGAVVTINGGTFNAMAKIVDPTNNTGVASKNAVVTIAGGTYSANPTDAPYNIVKLAEDYIAVENNGVWNVAKVVAKIGAEYYTSLADAFAAGGEVKVLQNIVLAETAIVPAGKVVTLDLNGKTISQTKECTASYEMICNKGNLTITGNGKISFTDTSAGDPNFGWGSYTVRNEGNLVVENGTIEHLGTQTFGTHCIMALYQYAGSTTINGGTISTPNYRSARLWKGNMTINGGTFDGQVWAQAVDNSANLVINGGTFEPNGNDASAVFVTNNQYDVQFAVTDGTFNGKVGCSDAVKLAGAIKGGKFNETAKNGTNSALLATGSIFGAVADANGYFAIEDDPTTHYIANLEDLKAFRDAVNNGTNYYAGVNVYLAADIDMTGENWVGIGTATADHGFMGNFDGKNFKIKNLTIDNPALDSDGYAYAGLFGVTEGTDKNNQNTIKNLTIENVTISTTGDIVSAAIAYPYYTIVDNVKVCGDIKIQGGNYTAGVLAYTRRCVNASNLSIVGNDGSFVKGNQTVGGVISDIQMNGGLTAVYSNFSAEGITVTGEKSVGGIAGIIATQTLNGATVKNVTLNSTDEFAGVVAGRLGGTSTISNVVSENVTGATAVIGATFDGAKAVEAKIGDIYYATLEAALAAQGNEVELLATYEVAAGETKTLDLKGKTVIGTPVEAKAYAVIINKGNLTITGNGSVICNHTLAGSTGYAVNTITNGGTLTIDGATIENKSTAQYQIGYAIDNNSTTGDAIINIKAGKVIASGSSYYDGIRLFCNSITKKNDVIVSGGEVSTIWMQNPSDGAEKNTKDVAGNVEISGGKVGVLSLEPSANFEAAVTGGHIGEISYFQTAEGRDLVQFVTGGSFDNDVNQFCALGYQAVETGGLYNVSYTGKVAEFTIVDGEYTEFNIEKKVEVGTLTYTRTIYEGWNALYVPFEIPVNELTNDFEVAYINDMHWVDKNDDFTMQTSEMTMEVIKIKNGTLKANHPYIIRPKNGANIAMNLELNNVILHKTSEKVDVEFSSAYVEYKVSGTYTKAGVDILNNGNDIYIVSGDNFGVMNNAYPLPAFRIFMTVENKEGSPVIIDQSAPIRIRVAGEKDEATGIITPIIEGDVHVNDGTVYDLMGRPVRTPEKGKIYIMNGKKVLF